jgi:chromosome segregation ATPase
LQQKVRELQQELYNRNRQLEEAETRAQNAESRAAAAEAGVTQLRQILSPLHQALGMVFGEIDSMNPPSQVSDSRVSAVWESWKQKLGGKQAEFIDAMLTHGEMTATQLKIATKSGQQTVYDTIHKLNKAGLINKNGGKFSLKEL